MPMAAIMTSIVPAAAPAPIISALCWSHARRKFFELAGIAGNVRKGKPAQDISPVALEAVARIDTLFDSERGINGIPAEDRFAARQQHARPLVEELHDKLMAQRSQMSKHNPVAKATNHMFEKDGRWEAFTRSIDDGRWRPDGTPDACLHDRLRRHTDRRELRTHPASRQKFRQNRLRRDDLCL